MKKILIISAFVVTFILGVVLSGFILQGLNGIFGKGTFDTTGELKEQIEVLKNQSKELEAASQKKYDFLAGKMKEKEANLNSLIKEMDAKINPTTVKDILLTTPSDQTGDKGTLFLKSGSGEGLLTPTTTDDPMVNRFKKSFNDKAKAILDVSKGILKEKIGQLNNELLRINNQLKDRNVQVIGKLKEIEKLNKSVDEVNNKLTDRNKQLESRIKEVGKLKKDVEDVNSKLSERNKQLEGKIEEVGKLKKDVDDRNRQLESKLKEVETLKQDVDKVNKELKGKNDQLNEKLNEVEKYKKELDEQKKYINDLEGVKSNLEKTVGVLETKIENGRLKVSFKGDILFQSGEHQLRQGGNQLLDRVFNILQESVKQNDIFVAGHTDNVPIRAEAKERYESNWTLSTYRAIEVVKYLVSKGMSPKHLTAAGYGEFKPIADNKTDEGRSKNRRVELYLIPRIIKR